MQIISYLHLNLTITFTQRPHKHGETFVSLFIRDTKNTQKFRQSLNIHFHTLTGRIFINVIASDQ